VGKVASAVTSLLILAVLTLPVAAYAAVTDSFTAYPFEIAVTRVLESRTCSTYSVAITITALEDVELKGGNVELLLYDGGVLASKAVPAANLSRGESRQIVIQYRYCPDQPRDPILLLKLSLDNNVTGTVGLRYFISRVESVTLSDALSRIRELESEVDKLRSIISEKDRLIDELRRRIDELRGELESLRDELRSEKSRAEELLAMLADARARLNETRMLLGRARERIRELEDAVKRLTAELEAEKALRAGAEERLRNLSAEYDELMDRYVEALRVIDSLRARLNATRAELKALEARYAELERNYSELMGRYRELVGEHRRLNAMYMELRGENRVYGTALMVTIAALGASIPPAAMYVKNRFLKRVRKHNGGNGASAS